MQPVLNQILFKPFMGSEISEGGLIIPENARELSDRGIIEKVGRGTAKKPMKLKEGMIGHRVHKWGEEIIIEGETYFLMDEAAILAIE